MALGYTQATGGATLTAEEVNREVIEPLTAKSVVLRAARDQNSPVYTTNGVPLKLPRITNVPITDPWRSENTEITAVDPTLDSVNLLPSSLKSLKTLVKMSDEVVKHAVARDGAVGIIGAAIVNEIGLILDEAFLIGPGTSNTIKGLAAASSIQTMPAVGEISIDHLHDAMSLGMSANATPSAWFCHPRDLISLRKLRATTGEYLLQPDAREASSWTLLGLPVYLSTRIETDGGTGDDESRLLLVDMQQVAIARDVDMEVRVLRERYAEFGQVGIRVVCRWDIAPRNPEGIVVLQGVQPPAAWTPPTP